MADINIKRFVDINIKYHEVSGSDATREVAILLSTEILPDASKLFNSLAEWEKYIADNSIALSTVQLTDAYIRVFFANNGAKLEVYSNVGTDKTALTTLIKSLKDEKIVIAYTGDESLLREIAKERAADISIYGINEKILVGRTVDSATPIESGKGIKNYALKYSTKIGCEMTIAAYLTQVNIDEVDSIKDYAFTRELGYYTSTGTKIEIAEPNDDTILGNVLDNNLNVIMNMAQNDRNLGGNVTNGDDLTNTFVLIVLQQTLTNRIFELLSSKIKGDTGLSAIHSVIDAEMVKYVTNGYLSTDKVWKDKDLIIEYNNQKFTLIKKGDPLLLGYQVKLIPFSALSDEDKLKRKTPPIYLIIADSYGIRSVTLNGEII